MAFKADLETIKDEIEESTSTVEQASHSTDRFFSIKENSSMDEGFNSFDQSTLNTTNKFFTPKKMESTTDDPDMINSVGSKTKEIAKSLEHLDFSAMSARHSTPQKYLNKTVSCQDIKRRMDEFSPVKSHSLENGIDVSYPHTITDLGLSPRAIRPNTDVFKALEDYTYDIFKKVMKKMKKSHMTAAEAKLKTVIDEMKKAINKSTEDCSEPIATQVLKHINESKRLKNQILNADVTVNDQEQDVSVRSNTDGFKAFFENYTYDMIKTLMKKMKKSRMTAGQANLRTMIDEMDINQSMEDCTEPIAIQELKHINETRRRSLNADVSVNDEEEDVSQKPSEDAEEGEILQNYSSDNEDSTFYDTIITIHVSELLLKDNVNSFSLASGSDIVTRDLTYQIVKDFQTLADIVSYNTTLDSSVLDGRDLTNEPQNKQNFIREHIYINEQIIEQITKLMKFAYKRQPNFLGSFIHLEGERLFLLAKTRRDVLLSNIYEVPKPVNEESATISIEKLACRFIISKSLNRLNLNSFFLCILEHKDTVYSTPATILNPNGSINFGGHFIFENVSNKFNIKISVYSLAIKIATPSCINFAFLRRRPQLPMMSLIGVARIGLMNAEDQTFSIRNAENVLRPDYKLDAVVEANLNCVE